MANKKSAKIFLIIGLTAVILSIIGTIIEIVYTYNIILQKFKTEPIRQSIELFGHLFSVGLFVVPIFAEELSFVRSVYKLLKGGLKRLEKVCCIVSASLLLLMILFHWLIVTGSIRFDMIDEQKFVRTILFLTEWPTVILSFVLSSIRSRNKEDRAKNC